MIAIVIARCIASALCLSIQYVNIPESMFDSLNVPKLADAGLFASPCFWGTMIGFAPALAYADHATLEKFNEWPNRRPGKVLMEWDAFHQPAKGKLTLPDISIRSDRTAKKEKCMLGKPSFHGA